MTSTLCIRRTPAPDSAWRVKQPLKGVIAKHLFDHDGSLGGSTITIGPEHREWFAGVLASGAFIGKEAETLQFILKTLDEGGSLDLWFEV